MQMEVPREHSQRFTLIAFHLLEALLEVVGECLDRHFFIGAFELQFECRTLRCRKRHDADDRLAINAKAIFDDVELGLELAGELHDGRSGPGMKARSILDCYRLLGHLKTCRSF